MPFIRTIGKLPIFENVKMQAITLDKLGTCLKSFEWINDIKIPSKIIKNGVKNKGHINSNFLVSIDPARLIKINIGAKKLE